MALPDTVTASVAAVEQYVGHLPPEYQDAFHTALVDLKNVLEMEVDTAVKAQTAKYPIIGGLAGSLITGAVNKALDDAMTELTNAKTAYSTGA